MRRLIGILSEARTRPSSSTPPAANPNTGKSGSESKVCFADGPTVHKTKRGAPALYLGHRRLDEVAAR